MFLFPPCYVFTHLDQSCISTSFCVLYFLYFLELSNNGFERKNQYDQAARRMDQRTQILAHWYGHWTISRAASVVHPKQKQINNNLFRAQVGGRTLKSYNLASIIKALNSGRHDTMLSSIVPFLANLYQPIVIGDELCLTFSPVSDVLKYTLPIFKM